MIVLWFPVHANDEVVVDALKTWMLGKKPHHQQVQDWVNARYPSYQQRRVFLNHRYVLLDTMCSICWDSDGDMHGQCGHFFHKRCIKQWLPQSATCPLCRRSMTL